MVWMCGEEGYWIQWVKDAEDLAVKQEKSKKSKQSGVMLEFKISV